MKGWVVDWVAAFFLLCVVGMLAKPGSTASTAISSFTTSLTTLIGMVTGGGSSTSSQGGASKS
jgi:hypothetical protein